MNFRSAMSQFFAPGHAPLVRATALGLVCSLLALAPPAFGADAGASEAFDSPESAKGSRGIQATSLARAEYEVVVVQYWSLGSLLRAEAVMGGNNIVTLVDADTYAVYDTLSNRGYRVQRSAGAKAGDAIRKRPFGMHLQEMLDQGGEKIREEAGEGIAVDVYRVTDEQGRRTLWVRSGEAQIPIRLETYERTQGRTGRLDWVNWLEGVEIPASFFTPPSEVVFEEIGSFEELQIRASQAPLRPAPPFFPELID